MGTKGVCRVCIDRALPLERQTEAARLAVSENAANKPTEARLKLLDDQAVLRLCPIAAPVAGLNPRLRMAILTSRMWAPGKRLKVSFLDGDSVVQERVVAVAKEWETYANLALEFGYAAQPEIRVSFRDKGSWSYVGTDALSIPLSSATVNFGWLDRDESDDEYHNVVLHEFGHVLGCVHEHQSPASGIKWNKERVYETYGASPNFWTREEVDLYVFAKYDQTITQYTTFDPASIMMYEIPAEFTTDGFSSPKITQLSDTDRAYIAKAYPR